MKYNLECFYLISMCVDSLDNRGEHQLQCNNTRTLAFDKKLVASHTITVVRYHKS